MSKDPIFITGRFRAGTSFLWQVFDALDDCCAWYEPLHPQLLSAIEHTRPKADHVGISDYWGVYRTHPEFKENHSNHFAVEAMYLEAEDDFPELEVYINHLIELSGENRPVLQFNRVDLRLPWLKAKFPSAKIIHIQRNPLQLFHSQRKHLEQQHVNDALYWDAYELPSWCFSLSQQLPIFSVTKAYIQPAFYDFYLLYKLSQLMANHHADVWIDLEQHVFQSTAFIGQLKQVIALSAEQEEKLIDMIHVPESLAISSEESDVFAAIMTSVDCLLSESGLDDGFGVLPLNRIKARYKDFWQAQMNSSFVIKPMLLEIENHKQELTRVLAENAALKEQAAQCSKTEPNKHEGDRE